MSAILQPHGPLAVVYEEHFQHFVTGDRYTSLAADSGASVAVGDAAAGGIVLTTGATDNNEAAVRTTNEIYAFRAAKPFGMVAKISYAEANTDDANVMVGFMNALGANAMLDNGAGPKASFSGAIIYKVDGGTRWQCRSSIGTTYVSTDLVGTDLNNRSRTTQTAGGAQTLEIRVSGQTLAAQTITYLIDGVLVAQHVIDATSGTEMNLGAYVKAGSANSEVVTVTYLREAINL